MRIIKFLFFSLLWILGLGSIIFFLGRELLLVWQSSVIKSDYNSLLNNNHAVICTEKYSYAQDSWSQLRFVSNKEYKLEAICSDFATLPLEIKTRKLLPLVSKTSSSSGFNTSENALPSFIEISVLGRKTYLYTDGKEIHSTYFKKPDLDYDQGPLSSCEAHNYQCCSLDWESGVGEQLADVNDCPKSCFSSCLLRPSILLFNTRPAFDDLTRTVAVSSGESVSFSYVVGNGKSDAFSGQLDQEENKSWLKKIQALFTKSDENADLEGIALPVTVTIDFGDGQTWQSSNLKETTEHTYTCINKSCYYQATINAKDAQGVLSANNELAKMVIKVR